MPDLVPNCSLKDFVSPFQAEVLQSAAAVAQKIGFRLYAVGGIVRDWILASDPFVQVRQGAEFAESSFESSDLKDIDLVVEPLPIGESYCDQVPGILVAIALQKLHPEAKLQIHPKFQTAELMWTGEHSFSLDLATARTEIYPFAGANPEVAPANLSQDLYRRDFTINAMAVGLNAQFEGAELIDLFQGYQDLKARQVRAIRSGSFAEDPRRIFRAVRFAVRFEMAIAAETKTEIEQLLASGLHDCIGGSRLRAELNYLLEPQFLVKKTALIWRSLAQLGALRCIYAPFELPNSFELDWKRWQRYQNYFVEIVGANLEFLLSYFPQPQELNLGLTTIQQKRLSSIAQLTESLSQLIEAKPSQITQVLEKFDLITLLIYATKTSDRYNRKIIWQYAQTWRKLKSPITGTELQQLGCPPGKAIGIILAALRNAVLDSEIEGQASAKLLAQQLIERERI